MSGFTSSFCCYDCFLLTIRLRLSWLAMSCFLRLLDADARHPTRACWPPMLRYLRARFCWTPLMRCLCLRFSWWRVMHLPLLVWQYLQDLLVLLVVHLQHQVALALARRPRRQASKHWQPRLPPPPPRKHPRLPPPPPAAASASPAAAVGLMLLLGNFCRRALKLAAMAAARSWAGATGVEARVSIVVILANTAA